MDKSSSADAPVWTRLYTARARHGFTPEYRDLLAMFRDCVATHADSQALCYFDRTLSWADLDRYSDALAAWLQAHGCGRGDRVCVKVQNIPAFPIACLAAWKAGAIPVPINPMYRSAELRRIVEDARPMALLCEDSDVTDVRFSLADTEYSKLPIVTTSPWDWQSLDAPVLPQRGDSDPEIDLRSVIENTASCRPGVVSIQPGDIGLILYTSGTTGVPKGAMLTHESLASNTQVVRDWCDLEADSLIFAMAPFFHITGFVCHFCAAISARCAMVMNYRFEPHLALDMIRHWRPTFTVGAITAFNALLRLPGILPDDMRSFRQIFSGGAPIPPALRQEIEQRLGFAIHPAYGMTETTSPAIFAPLGVPVPTRNGVLSIGIAVPNTEIRIVGDGGIEVGAGEAGEILLRGPQIMRGYWNKPEDTAETLVGGWMHTGDVGFMDEAGWVYLVDRKKDVIIASGFKVWPREVEDVLYLYPAVREAAVVGAPDNYRGETVKAVVSLQPGAAAEAADIVRHCRQHLAGYKVPRLVDILDDLPKTVSGKIQRAALRRDLPK